MFQSVKLEHTRQHADKATQQILRSLERRRVRVLPGRHRIHHDTSRKKGRKTSVGGKEKMATMSRISRLSPKRNNITMRFVWANIYGRKSRSLSVATLLFFYMRRLFALRQSRHWSFSPHLNKSMRRHRIKEESGSCVTCIPDEPTRGCRLFI